MRIAILVSGNGSNLQAIIDAVAEDQLPNIEIACVIADRNCYAIERALDAEIPMFYVERETNLSATVHEICNEEDVELIVLAGFLSILSAEFCKEWQNQIINLHPSLLPKYGGIGMYGNKVHQAVIAAQDKQSGVTVHYVTEHIDGGEIILQQPFDIPENATAEDLAKIVSELEKPLLIKALYQLSQE